MNKPLKVSTVWRRWLVSGSDDSAIHRVSAITWDDSDEVTGEGVTVCGLKSRLFVGGVFDRLSAPRCPECCRLLGIPDGKGAPFNAKIPEPEGEE